MVGAKYIEGRHSLVFQAKMLKASEETAIVKAQIQILEESSDKMLERRM